MYSEQAHIIIPSITVSIYKRSSHLANIFIKACYVCELFSKVIFNKCKLTRDNKCSILFLLHCYIPRHNKINFDELCFLGNAYTISYLHKMLLFHTA
jgi:hypothetical protein